MNSRTQSPVPAEAVATTTINHLHDEILTLIMAPNAFRLYQPISNTCDVKSQRRSNRTPIPPHLRDTINASQVCRRWRIVALASPELWSHMIDMEHPRPEWTKLLLDRSEPLGITFMTWNPSRYDGGEGTTFELEMRLNARIDEYRLLLIPHLKYMARLLHTLSYYFKIWGNFPRLKSLNIQLEDRRGYEWVNNAKVLRELFPCDNIPNLRSLYVRGGIPVHYPGLKSLHKLTTLHVFRPPRNNLMEVNIFLNILNHLPFLKDISLVYAFQKPTSNTQTSKNTILPLEKLVLHDDSITLARVLRSVTFQHKGLRQCDIDIHGEESDFYVYRYLTHLLPILFHQVTKPTSLHQRNKITFTRDGFGITSIDQVPPTRKFHFHFPSIDNANFHTLGHYYALGKTYSDLIHMILLGLPTSLCATIDTVTFYTSRIFPSFHQNCRNWLVAFFKSVFCEKLPCIRHILGVPWNWGRFMHTLVMPLNGWEKPAIQSYLQDSDVLNILSKYSDCYGISSYPMYGQGFEGVTVDLDFSELNLNSNNQTTRGVDLVTIQERIQKEGTTNTGDNLCHSQPTEDPKASERWTTSYLLRPFDSDTTESDTGSLYDTDSSSDDSSGPEFEPELTLYEGLVELCQEISTIRKVSGVPRMDESLEPDILELFEPRSMIYLEEELKVLGVEVDFVRLDF